VHSAHWRPSPLLRTLIFSYQGFLTFSVEPCPEKGFSPPSCTFSLFPSFFCHGQPGVFFLSYSPRVSPPPRPPHSTLFVFPSLFFVQAVNLPRGGPFLPPPPPPIHVHPPFPPRRINVFSPLGFLNLAKSQAHPTPFFPFFFFPDPLKGGPPETIVSPGLFPLISRVNLVFPNFLGRTPPPKGKRPFPYFFFF